MGILYYKHQKSTVMQGLGLGKQVRIKLSEARL